MRFPNLLVIGAMKSGTTSLHNYLSMHPDIFMSEPKEIHYYADGTYQEWSKEKYMKFFQTDCKYAGTSPQSYTKCHNKYYQHIPERIYKDTPDVKMIYIVRDPIERYKSHILESYHCDNIADIKYSKECGNYIKTSMYGMQLKAYLKYFKLEQIYIMSLEELQSNPLTSMHKLFDFLKIDRIHDKDIFTIKNNTAESKRIPRIIKSNIFFKVGLKLNKSITNEIANRVAEKYFENQLKKPSLTNSEIELLKKKLHNDINEFRQLSGKKFEEWSI